MARVAGSAGKRGGRLAESGRLAAYERRFCSEVAMAARVGSLRRADITQLILVRHGLTPTTGRVLPGRMPGLHLSDEGRAQAESVADALGPSEIAAIYSSPLERAVETARPLSRRKSLPIRRMAELADVDPGKWEGRSIKSLRKTKYWEVISTRPTMARFPEGESFVEAAARSMRAVEKMLSSDGKGAVVAFSHADPIKLMVSHLIGLPLDYFSRLEVSPGSVTVVELGRLDVRLVALNRMPAG